MEEYIELIQDIKQKILTNDKDAVDFIESNEFLFLLNFLIPCVIKNYTNVIMLKEVLSLIEIIYSHMQNENYKQNFIEISTIINNTIESMEYDIVTDVKKTIQHVLLSKEFPLAAQVLFFSE